MEGTPSRRYRWPHPLGRGSARMCAVITAAAVVLVIATGCTETLRDDDAQPTTPPAEANPPGIATFDDITTGYCLTWPDEQPDAIDIVSCGDEHRFEVASVVDVSTLPGGGFGPDAEPPSLERIQQISEEHCLPAVRQYLGAKYDPNSRFTVSMLWAGEVAWKLGGERRMMCGLQLPGPDNERQRFTGRVADLDQSRVWSPGTCIGIDPTTSRPTDLPVDCAAPHAMEVTGAVDVGERFPGGFPSDAEQDAFVRAGCTSVTDAYLAPVTLRSTTLTLIYSTVSEPSWTAGSRKASCNIGAVDGDGRWATLLNTAKGPLLINGQPPAP